MKEAILYGTWYKEKIFGDVSYKSYKRKNKS